MTIHFTPAELEALARTPRQQFADACAAQSIDDTVATMARLAKSFRNFIDGFSAFGVGVAEYVRDTHGFDAAAALDAAVFRAGLRELAARHVDPATNADFDDADLAAVVRGRLLVGDQAGALDAYDQYEARVRDLHDVVELILAFWRPTETAPALAVTQTWSQDIAPNARFEVAIFI